MVCDFFGPAESGKLDCATGARLASIAKKRIRDNEQTEKNHNAKGATYRKRIQAFYMLTG
jgi:hypothetical protein